MQKSSSTIYSGSLIFLHTLSLCFSCFLVPFLSFFISENWSFLLWMIYSFFVSLCSVINVYYKTKCTENLGDSVRYACFIFVVSHSLALAVLNLEVSFFCLGVTCPLAIIMTWLSSLQIERGGYTLSRMLQVFSGTTVLAIYSPLSLLWGLGSINSMSIWGTWKELHAIVINGNTMIPYSLCTIYLPTYLICLSLWICSVVAI